MFNAYHMHFMSDRGWLVHVGQPEVTSECHSVMTMHRSTSEVARADQENIG